jgi:hypothetical protein
LDDIPVGYAGAIVNQEPRVLISRTVEDALGIAFGLAVMQGTNDKGCVVSDGSSFLGVTVRELSVGPSAPNSFAFEDSARIMTKGVIWVANSGGVVAGDAVAAGAAGALSATTGTGIDGARWDTTADDGVLAQLRLA